MATVATKLTRIALLLGTFATIALAGGWGKWG